MIIHYIYFTSETFEKKHLLTGAYLILPVKDKYSFLSLTSVMLPELSGGSWGQIYKHLSDSVPSYNAL